MWGRGGGVWGGERGDFTLRLSEIVLELSAGLKMMKQEARLLMNSDG